MHQYLQSLAYWTLILNILHVPLLFENRLLISFSSFILTIAKLLLCWFIAKLWVIFIHLSAETSQIHTALLCLGFVSSATCHLPLECGTSTSSCQTLYRLVLWLVGFCSQKFLHDEIANLMPPFVSHLLWHLCWLRMSLFFAPLVGSSHTQVELLSEVPAHSARWLWGSLFPVLPHSCSLSQMALM